MAKRWRLPPLLLAAALLAGCATPAAESPAPITEPTAAPAYRDGGGVTK